MKAFRVEKREWFCEEEEEGRKEANESVYIVVE